MNRERAKELLPIIQAFAEGKEIQWGWGNESEKLWVDFNDGDYSFESDDDFRIKPLPVEGWTVGRDYYYGSMKASKEEAETFLAELSRDNPGMYDEWRVFKMREVD